MKLHVQLSYSNLYHFQVRKNLPILVVNQKFVIVCGNPYHLNSLIMHQAKTKEIITMKVLGHFILIILA